MNEVLLLITIVLSFWLCFPLISITIAAFNPLKNVTKGETQSSRFACIITVYQNLDIAWPLVRSLLKQNYSNYRIYLVADGIASTVKPEIENYDRLVLLQPDKPLRSKVASIDYALRKLDSSYTHAVIFDPDNLVPAHFLSALDKSHCMGFEIVQGKRIAKNIDTAYAALDALGEYYYDFTVRQVPFRLGSSSTIAGSGMSISLDVYRKNIQKEMEEFKTKGVVVAEDKSLQMDFVAQQKRIAYCPQAVLFDEKVSSGEQVSRQRTRWLNSYFRHSKDALALLFRGLRLFNWNIFYFALMILFPPMSVLMLSSLLMLGITSIFLPELAILLGLSIAIFWFSFILALLQNATPAAVLKAIPQIPLFVAKQMGGLLQIRKANKDFMATSHNYIVEIDELWQKRKLEFKKWITT